MKSTKKRVDPTADDVSESGDEGEINDEAAGRVRADPSPREVTAAGPLRNRLVNRDPGRKYIWAYLADPDSGAPYFEALGYEVERYNPDGVRPASTLKLRAGEPIENMGSVLMSIPIEQAEQIERVGVEGTTGQQWLDVVEKRLRMRNTIVDPTRGFLQQNKYVSVREYNG